MKVLSIPEIGDHLRLTSDWTFPLYDEYRNKSLWDLYECDEKPNAVDYDLEVKALEAEREAIFNKYRNNQQRPFHFIITDPVDEARLSEVSYKINLLSQKRVDITIPVGSTLTIDRIFIRKGMSDFSSLSFYLRDHPGHTFKKKPRFWAKLEDCNRIEYESI
jgi:hypothetical protein